MATFWVLFVIAGGGFGTSAWGGPAMLRFETQAECEAAASVMKNHKRVYEAECVPVNR